ncbi:DUF1801 domain-containing protein [Gordonia insulae]|uniref:YdhG-like domain-containing protein n=1 Tax=Gordonia insulae TaxID=2420509 RepID=A0A3G8JP72_9ACTN|nr:DUF1801 domain-containing protein [Gordonia insulae]AZG46881.1 hypothetical protein D7316_03486 [Gordonia insulae]
MKPTAGDVDEFLAKTSPEQRRRDAETMTAILREITGREPVLWGSIVGFGACHYRYPTGTEGDSPILAFAARKKATTVYLLDGIDAHTGDLATLGPHQTGRGCLYLGDVDATDRAVLRSLLAESYRRVVDNAVPGAEITVTD